MSIREINKKFNSILHEEAISQDIFIDTLNKSDFYRFLSDEIIQNDLRIESTSINGFKCVECNGVYLFTNDVFTQLVKYGCKKYVDDRIDDITTPFFKFNGFCKECLENKTYTKIILEDIYSLRRLETIDNYTICSH